jgi:AraC-like DNA-binding protein
MPAMVRAALLSNYAATAKRLGLDPRAYLAQHDLPISVLNQPDRRIPASIINSLLEQSALDSGCGTFGLEMASTRQMSDFGVVGLLLTHQPSLRAALKITQDYRYLLNDSLIIDVEESDNLAIIREEIVSDNQLSNQQSNDYGLGVLFKMFQAFLGPQWHPHSIYFSHRMPADPKPFRDFFGCPCYFAADFNGLVCTSRDLDTPNQVADPVMRTYLERFLESLRSDSPLSLGDEVRQAIAVLLPLGRSSIDQIAPTLGVHPRTLQRRLQEQELSYSSLLLETRVELLKRYMANGQYSLGSIAELLGYASAPAFTRWFQGHFNESPRSYRKRLYPTIHASRAVPSLTRKK